MNIIRCGKGHFYDAEVHSACPACAKEIENYEQLSFGVKKGTVLRERYVAGRVLGRGGFSITYVGYDLTLECKVAIREYFPANAVTRHNTISNCVRWDTRQFDREAWQKGCERFLKAAGRMEKLDSLPGIARVRDTFQENQTAYIIMDYRDGETLKERLMKTGIITYTECLRILRPIMESLEKMHRQGFIHCNIAPHNIMIQSHRSTSAFLLDFDAAKDSFDDEPQPYRLVSEHGFSPLELYLKKGDIGSWTDVYALCATIYYCVTGKLIPNPLNRLDALTFDLPMLEEPLSEAVISALRDGLKLRPEERIQTVEGLLERLEGAKAETKNI